MTAQLQALTHGTSALVIAYALVLVALVAGLAQAHAAAHKYLLAPLLAAPLLLLAALCISLLAAVPHRVALGRGECGVDSAHGRVLRFDDHRLYRRPRPCPGAYDAGTEASARRGRRQGAYQGNPSTRCGAGHAGRRLDAAGR